MLNANLAFFLRHYVQLFIPPSYNKIESRHKKLRLSAEEQCEATTF